jgi:poly(3-hydroxybutyrate) depolymerase
VRSLVPALALLCACGSTGVVPDDQLTGDPNPSRCTVTHARADCAHETLVLTYSNDQTREVHWQVPNGEPPATGWPTVLMFQGSFFSAEHNWAAKTDDPFGALYQTLTLKRLLDSGFAVLTPETRENGGTYWDTNIWPWAGDWEHSGDALMMAALFEQMDQGTFGPLDATRLFATGISSGGYMTSRMALSYPGKCRALAVVSASWATCGGSWCAMPDKMPDRHPPTLFLHGKADATVPYGTMADYESQLRREGYETSIISSESAGHEWLPAAPEAVTNWFSDRL